ncbi:MAG: WecB/TagA/CpsF family glycosyltransferase [Chloroflexi bacterium]|nr:WecB/TagA/CpsF family glycosyltransferase [Chloroflexota bacterium]
MVPRSIRILDVRIDDVDIDEACVRAAALIDAGGIHQFATVNPEFVTTAQRDAHFLNVLEQCALALADGVGITLAARLRGAPLRGRVTGVDLTQRLCTLAAQRGWGVFLLGAAPGVAEKAAAVLCVRNPGLRIAGCHAGSPRPEHIAEIDARIAAAQPQILFVAYGAPAQDFWLHEFAQRHSAQTNGLLGMGVGGTFDYLAGVRRYAPRWMRHIGLEWLHRLLSQPSRWRRQISLLHFAACAIAEAVKILAHK